MVQDRQGVARKITENVVPDMRKLGLEVVNFNIQNFKDGAGTIENMGIDNVEQIRKNAQIAKANAQRDILLLHGEAQGFRLRLAGLGLLDDLVGSGVGVPLAADQLGLGLLLGLWWAAKWPPASP